MIYALERRVVFNDSSLCIKRGGVLGRNNRFTK